MPQNDMIFSRGKGVKIEDLRTNIILGVRLTSGPTECYSRRGRSRPTHWPKFPNKKPRCDTGLMIFGVCS